MAVAEGCPYLSEAITDPPLTFLGQQDCARVRTAIQNSPDSFKPDLYVTSPLRRAAQTMVETFQDDLAARPEVPCIAAEDSREQIGVFCCDKRLEKV